MRYLFCGPVAASLSLVILTAICIGSPANAANIDTLTGWNGTDEVHDFGAAPNFAVIETYGQVITPDASQTLLTSFTFNIRPVNGGTWQFRPYIFQWNGTRATGTALFTGTPTTLLGDNTYHKITANVASVTLTKDQPYVLLFSVAAADDYAASDAFAGGNWAARPTDPYTGGTFVFQDSISSNQDVTNGAGLANLTSKTWSSFPTFDTAFQANFSVAVIVPEASTMLLAPLAMMGLLIHRRFRKPTK